jgi:hypothetical protein
VNAEKERPLVGRIGVSPNTPSFKLGGMRTHLAAAALLVCSARSSGVPARLLVRIDDTNQTRARRDFEKPLLDELEQVAQIPLSRLGAASGTPWVMRQSERLHRYRDAAQALRSRGLAETLDDGTTIVRVQGERLVPVADLAGDAVRITRVNGWPLWHFASAVDDLDMGVGVCVRGIDKHSAEPVQRALIDAQGGTAPIFYYLPKLADTQRADRVRDLLRSGLRRATLFEYIASSLLRKTSGCTTFDDLSSAIDVRSDLRSKLHLDHGYLAKLDRQVSTRLDRATITNDFEQYCRLHGDSITLDYIATHDVGTLLAAYRRPLGIHYQLVSAIAHKRFSRDRPPTGTATALPILAYSPKAAFEHLLRIGLSKKEAHGALRWVLCGLLSGPDFDTLWAWHQEQGSLRDRLAAAKQLIVN